MAYCFLLLVMTSYEDGKHSDLDRRHSFEDGSNLIHSDSRQLGFNPSRRYSSEARRHSKPTEADTPIIRLAMEHRAALLKNKIAGGENDDRAIENGESTQNKIDEHIRDNPRTG